MLRMLRFLTPLALSLFGLACSDDGSTAADGTGGSGNGSPDGGGGSGSDAGGSTTYTYSSPGERGPFPVGVVSTEFVDESRDETFNPTPVAGEKRVLVTSVWYPAAESARGTPGTDEAGAVDAPVGDGPYPLVIFSHGNTGINAQSQFLTAHLASHGYIVMSPNHRFNTLADYNGATFSAEGFETRIADVSYLVDVMTQLDADDPDGRFTGRVDLEHVGITGHSYGGITTLGALGQDDRFLVGAPITAGGAVLVGGLDAVANGVAEPTMHFLATEDHTVGASGNAEIETMYDRAEGPKVILRIRDAGHYSPTIMCDIAPDSQAGDGCISGTRLADPTQTFDFIDYHRVWDMLNFYETALFGFYLKGVSAYGDDLTATPFQGDIESESSELP